MKRRRWSDTRSWYQDKRPSSWKMLHFTVLECLTPGFQQKGGKVWLEEEGHPRPYGSEKRPAFAFLSWGLKKVRGGVLRNYSRQWGLDRYTQLKVIEHQGPSSAYCACCRETPIHYCNRTKQRSGCTGHGCSIDWASQKSSLRMQSAVKHAQTSFSSPDSVMCSLYLKLKQPQDTGKCLFSRRQTGL